MSEPKSDPYAAGQPSNGFSSDPYAKSKPSNVNGGDPYARSNTEKPGDNPYAKRSTQIDATRDELFSGYKAPDKPAAERKFGYEGRETEEDFDEDEEVEGIRQEMRGLKQDSLASTRWVWAGRRGEWWGESVWRGPRGAGSCESDSNEADGPRRNALRLAREAEENARGTVSKLADQSGMSRSSIKGAKLIRSW